MQLCKIRVWAKTIFFVKKSGIQALRWRKQEHPYIIVHMKQAATQAFNKVIRDYFNTTCYRSWWKPASTRGARRTPPFRRRWASIIVRLVLRQQSTTLQIGSDAETVTLCFAGKQTLFSFLCGKRRTSHAVTHELDTFGCTCNYISQRILEHQSMRDSGACGLVCQTIDFARGYLKACVCQSQRIMR